VKQQHVSYSITLDAGIEDSAISVDEFHQF